MGVGEDLRLENQDGEETLQGSREPGQEVNRAGPHNYRGVGVANHLRRETRALWATFTS